MRENLGRLLRSSRVGLEEKGACSTGSPSPPRRSSSRNGCWKAPGSLEQDSKGNSRAEAAGALWNKTGLGPGSEALNGPHQEWRGQARGEAQLFSAPSPLPVLGLTSPPFLQLTRPLSAPRALRVCRYWAEV